MEYMTKFLNTLKDADIAKNIAVAKTYIDAYLLPIIHESGESLEGNIFMLHHTTTYTDVFANKAKNISNLVLNPNVRNVAEIGFNAGFSALLMLLSNPELHLSCFDLGEHAYTRPCYDQLKQTFGDRIELCIGDSIQTLPTVSGEYDMVHIDGGHSFDVARSDILNAYRLSRTGTVLIMDDYDFPELHKLWDSFILWAKLAPVSVFVYPTPHHDIRCVVKN
jgi:predicted O-methyltransferase YrrM